MQTNVTTKEQLGDAERTELQRAYIEKLNQQRDILKPAFELIEDKAHWKNPIDAWIKVSQFNLCAEACQYFTATELSATGEARRNNAGETEIRVKAAGYYGGPAN